MIKIQKYLKAWPITLVKETDKKIRIDKLIHDRGLAESRSQAQSIIMAGSVFINNQRVDKPGTEVNINSEIEIKNSKKKYVGRGGLKLEKAIGEFAIDTDNIIALDIGASTGGFTDCLLQKGAKKVYAFDVGHGQFDWKLRNNEKVVVREKINCRYLKFEDVGELVDLIVIDVSFISLKLIVSPALNVLKKDGVIIALIKPQFEAGRGEVGKGGVIRDEGKHREVVESIRSYFETLNLNIIGVTPSPIEGADGNKEFLICAIK